MKERNLYEHLTLKEIFQRLAESPNRVLYDVFFNRYYPKLIWFALLFVKQHCAAEEIVSDVLYNILRMRKKMATTVNIEGYIFIAVKNQSLKYLRKKKPQAVFDDFENEADLMMTTSVTPEYEYEENEFHRILRLAINSLPPKRRLVFRMVKEEGLKYNDVANLMDLSVKTVETHMGLALKTIHECIYRYKAETYLKPITTMIK